MENTESTYLDINISLPEVKFDSKLMDLIIELEKLRHRKLTGSTPFVIYNEIKKVFQLLESLGSARIEGNRTTITELAEKIIEKVEPKNDEKLREVLNINEAINFIKDNLQENMPISKALLFEVHKIITKDLIREGSKRSGELRNINNEITESEIKTPDFTQVGDYFDSLFNFINSEMESKYDLLKIAIAHHRFSYIHPFDNGNGRTVRLLTYAMLIKYGFKIKHGDIINPTAIFCIDRQKYYEMLSVADKGDDNSLIEWIVYVLEGLKTEMIKIDNLSDLEYTRSKILKPTIEAALEREYITSVEYKVLNYVISKDDMVFKAGDLEECLGVEYDARKRKVIIKRLKESGIVKPLGSENSRVYTIAFSSSYLFRSLIIILSKEGFIPDSLNKE